MAAGAVKVKGIRELVRAADASDKATKKAVRARLRKVGELVRAEAASRFSNVDGGSAAGFGVSVRATGSVQVLQRRRKTTGQRPDYGAKQMRDALLPALASKETELQTEMEAAINDIAGIFES